MEAGRPLLRRTLVGAQKVTYFLDDEFQGFMARKKQQNKSSMTEETEEPQVKMKLEKSTTRLLLHVAPPLCVHFK